MNNYESKLIDNKKEQLRDNFEHQKVEYFNNLLKEKDKEIENLKEEIKTLYRYTPEKGFKLVGDEDANRNI